MRIIATLFSIFLLASCTNNYGDTNTNDDAINKTDIKNDNTVTTNIENNPLLEDNSNPLIFNKINSLITYDEGQDKVDIKHDNTAISINLFGDDQSDITLMMDGSVVSKGLDGLFNYTYGLFNYTYEVDLQSALKRISVFANDADRQIVILPATTEEYLSYNAILFDDSGFLHTYEFEVAERDCGNIESITANTKGDANTIKVTDNTGKNCSTRTYLIDGEYLKEEPKSLSFTDIEAKYDENTHKIFTFDVNADGIDDKVISSINDENNNTYQGDDLIVYLKNTDGLYRLSLETTNFTDEVGWFLYDIYPSANHSGFILKIIYSPRGRSNQYFYFSQKNKDWRIEKYISEGALITGEDYYCIENNNVALSEFEYAKSATYSENQFQNLCPPPPTKYVIKTDQAEILDEKFESRSKPNYYIKGDLIEAFDQNEDWVKVSYKNGTKFGWIDKRDLSPVAD
ncbi:hypothetical protein IPZ60_06705 [Psychrobacter sp. NG25]|uniref:hypothetical protein n=1 Tax=Psychrobacter sp. NG25 TaxID=2782005 RepID=UPI00188486CF|nr:hypothetical protein [Psychrobacter sp. NG25]MBF0658425.1 hypothetical protein [Psychrobacter sp. NG25]